MSEQTAIAGRVVVARAEKSSLGARLRKAWPWYLFIAPNVLTFLAFTLFSWIFLIFLSFHNWNLLGAREYVGLENYSRMLNDRILHKALINTIQYAIMFVVPVSAVSLGLASLVNQRLRGMYLFRALYYLPVVTSIAVLAIIWKFILVPRPDGIANYLLGLVGIPYKEWLLDIRLALPSITVMQIWSTMGYYMVLWLAGLQGIPEEMYEAARIDGAGRWQMFRYVTVPMLKPTTIFITLIAGIGAFQMFGPPYMLTGGGPVHATTTMVYYIWQQAFNRYRMGYASGVSLLLFVIILIASLVQRKYMRWSESIF
ncbi:MAG: sugar ABC transporter permease [Anaerolineae bacterium]|nr:sugar ABC transporter permease [Anaerolineae bacterium]